MNAALLAAACGLCLLMIGLLYRVEQSLRLTTAANTRAADAMARSASIAASGRLAEWRANRHADVLGHHTHHAHGNASMMGGCAAD